MAKVVYTTVDRMVGEEFIRASPENPVKVDFGPIDPFGRKVKKKAKKIEFHEVEQDVVAPKSGERFKTKVKVPHEVEVEVEEYVLYTEAELRASGLIVKDEKDAPPAQTLKLPHAGAQVVGVPASARDKLEGGRPSDREP